MCSGVGTDMHLSFPNSHLPFRLYPCVCLSTEENRRKLFVVKINHLLESMPLLPFSLFLGLGLVSNQWVTGV